MPRLVSVSASDGTLWNVSAKYLGDPHQAGRIAALNGLSDFWLFDLTVPTELIIPDADATLSGYAPTDPGTDFRVLMGLVQPGVAVIPTSGQGGTAAESLTIISVRAVSAGVPFTVSLGYTGPLHSADYQIDGGQWLEASGIVIQNGGALLSIPGAAAGSHSVIVRDSANTSIQTAAFPFVVVTASGSSIPDTVAYDPNNDFSGDVEDMFIYMPVPAPLGQFVLGANCLAPDPLPLRFGSSDFSPDFEALGILE